VADRTNLLLLGRFFVFLPLLFAVFLRLCLLAVGFGLRLILRTFVSLGIRWTVSSLLFDLLLTSAIRVRL
jgi:hypothetical protein